MTLDEFLKTTEERIPTVPELIQLCETIGISFKMVDGKPALSVTSQNKAEGEVLARMFRREPFRSMVIKATLGEVAHRPEEKPEDSKEEDKPEPKEPLQIPPGIALHVVDKNGRWIIGNMKDEPYMFTWEGAEKWYYVRDYPEIVKGKPNV